MVNKLFYILKYILYPNFFNDQNILKVSHAYFDTWILPKFINGWEEKEWIWGLTVPAVLQSQSAHFYKYRDNVKNI